MPTATQVGTPCLAGQPCRVQSSELGKTINVFSFPVLFRAPPVLWTATQKRGGFLVGLRSVPLCPAVTVCTVFNNTVLLYTLIQGSQELTCAAFLVWILSIELRSLHQTICTRRYLPIFGLCFSCGLCVFKVEWCIQAWWIVSTIPALGERRQKDGEFKFKDGEFQQELLGHYRPDWLPGHFATQTSVELNNLLQSSPVPRLQVCDTTNSYLLRRKCFISQCPYYSVMNSVCS